MPYISNIQERMLSLLASQFQGTTSTGEKKNIQKFISAFASSFQQIENSIEQLRSERNLDTAIGIQLDGLGQILGLSRSNGENDSDYRERLKFQSYINNSEGTPEEIINILKFITNASKVRLLEIFPASFQLMTNGLNFPTPPSDLVRAIKEASPVAVQYAPITATYDEFPFVFSSDSELELLYVTDPSNVSNLVNLELDTTDLLLVNAQNSSSNSEGGGFAEYGSPDIDISGAGKLAEVIQL